MRLPKPLRADSWHAQRSLPDGRNVSRDADAISPPVNSRQAHALALVVAVAALGASAGVNLIDDPRPLDVQLSAALNEAGDTLRGWQTQLSFGLQVSLRAVADGRELPSADTAMVAAATAASQPTAEGR